MHRDRHDLGAVLRFLVKAIERVHRAPVHLVRRVVLQRHHHDVMQLEIVGQRHHRLVRGLQRHRLVVEHPVADIFDAGLRQIIERVEGLCQARPEPAARRPAPELADDVDGLFDRAGLVLDLVHWHLVVAVGVQLPAGVGHRLDHLRIGFAGAAVDGDGRRHLQPLEHALQSPEADPHAVLVPAPVRMIRQHRLALRRRDHHPRHRPRDVPLLERHQRPQDQAQAVRQFQRRAAFDGGEGEAFVRLHGGSRRRWRARVSRCTGAVKRRCPSQSTPAPEGLHIGISTRGNSGCFCYREWVMAIPFHTALWRAWIMHPRCGCKPRPSISAGDDWQARFGYQAALQKTRPQHIACRHGLQCRATDRFAAPSSAPMTRRLVERNWTSGHVELGGCSWQVRFSDAHV